VTKKLILRLSFGLVIFLSSLSLWYFFKETLIAWQNDGWLEKMIASLVSFIVLAAILGLFYLIEDDKRVISGSIILIFAGFFIVLPVSRFEEILVILLAAVFFIKGARRAYLEKANKIKLVLARILLVSLSSTVTALALLASIGFASAPVVQSLAGAKIIVPQATVEALADGLLRLSENLKISPVPPGSIKSSQLVPGLDQKAKDALYEQVNASLNNISDPYKRFLPFTLAISFFFAVRFLGIILVRISAMLAWFCFGLLRFLKIAEIKTISVEKEIVEV
jgi:hypothetical protein